MDEGQLLDFVTAEMLARLLSVSLEEIDDMLKRGALPKPVVIGGVHERFDYPQVRSMIAAGKLVGGRGVAKAVKQPLLPQETPSMVAVPVLDVRPSDASAAPRAAQSYRNLMSGRRRR